MQKHPQQKHLQFSNAAFPKIDTYGEVKVKHHPRRFGKSKYGFKRIPEGFFDLLTVLFLTKYKKRPMLFFAGIGSLFAGTGIAVLWRVAF